MSPTSPSAMEEESAGERLIFATLKGSNGSR